MSPLEAGSKEDTSGMACKQEKGQEEEDNLERRKGEFNSCTENNNHSAQHEQVCAARIEHACRHILRRTDCIHIFFQEAYICSSQGHGSNVAACSHLFKLWR